MISPTVLIFIVLDSIFIDTLLALACTKRHNLTFHLKSFEGQNVKEINPPDVLVRAHIVGTNSEIIYDNLDNLNTLRPGNKVEFRHQFQPNDSVTLAIQFMEENYFGNNYGKDPDHAHKEWTRSIFEGAMINVNHKHGPNNTRQERVYQKMHTIETISTNCTDHEDNTGGPVFAVETCNQRVHSFDCAFCVVVERRDCTTTTSTTTIATTKSSTSSISPTTTTDVTLSSKAPNLLTTLVPAERSTSILATSTLTEGNNATMETPPYSALENNKEPNCPALTVSRYNRLHYDNGTNYNDTDNGRVFDVILNSCMDGYRRVGTKAVECVTNNITGDRNWNGTIHGCVELWPWGHHKHNLSWIGAFLKENEEQSKACSINTNFIITLLSSWILMN